jgi:phage gp46-like protein
MDSRINPLTGDYDRTRTGNLDNAIYLRVTVPLGSYWADPKLGRRRRPPMKDLERHKNLFVRDVKDALQPLLDDKRADRIDAFAEWNHDGRLYLAVEVYQHGRKVGVFKNYVKVT